MSEDKIIKEIKKEESKFIREVKKNPWMPATIVLAIVLIVVVAIFGFKGGGVSQGTAVDNLLKVVEAQAGDSTVTSVVKEGNFYQVSISTPQGDMTVPVTLDGKYVVAGTLVQLTSEKKVVASTPKPTDKDKCSSDVATQIGLDIKKIEDLAFSLQGISLLKEGGDLATKYKASGSPTLIINGVQSRAIYSGTDTTKSAICSAFTTKPSECSGVPVNESGVVKNSRPVVELFVMSYCPYGVRAETNIAPLRELFGDKIDLKIRFIVKVSGEDINSVQSLHGITEAKEDARQLAIMQLYPDKYWAYLKEFNSVCYGGGASSSGSC